MDGTALVAVENFIAHVEEQVRQKQMSKDSGLEYLVSSEEKSRREQLMEEVIKSLGLTKFELLSKLSIDRATWDRWRSMTSIPYRGHLDSLKRFATHNDSNSGEENKTIPLPHSLLNANPHTWGHLKLIFRFYEWKNAIFHFKKPFNDSKIATEIALLTLKNCSVVYIMKEARQWCNDFSELIQKIFGKTLAARALSKICVIEDKNLEADGLKDFGLFNYETEHPNFSVGYIWKLKDKSNPQDNSDQNELYRFKSPDDAEDDVYIAFPGFDDIVSDLRYKYGGQISDAFTEIEGRRIDDFWSVLDAQMRDERLQIPIIQYKEHGGQNNE